MCVRSFLLLWQLRQLVERSKFEKDIELQLKKIVDTETEQKSLPAEADSEQKLKEIEAFLAKSDEELAKDEEEIVAIATAVRHSISFCERVYLSPRCRLR